MIVGYTKPQVKGPGGGGGLSESQSGAVLLCIEGESRKAVFLQFCQDLKIRVTCYLQLPNNSLFGMARDIAEEDMEEVSSYLLQTCTKVWAL